MQKPNHQNEGKDEGSNMDQTICRMDVCSYQNPYCEITSPTLVFTATPMVNKRMKKFLLFHLVILFYIYFLIENII